MGTEFNAFVAGHAVNPPLLPLTHATNGTLFAEMLKDGFFRVTECKHLKEKLLYTFYGKPAFRVTLPHTLPGLDKSDAAHSSPQYMPVCFLISSDLVKNGKRFFPFDTGAFLSGRYDGHLMTGDDDEEKERRCFLYELDQGTEVPPKFVDSFYGTNENYFKKKTVACFEETSNEYGSY